MWYSLESVLWLPLGSGRPQRTSHLQVFRHNRLGGIYSSEHWRRSSVTFLCSSPQLSNHKSCFYWTHISQIYSFLPPNAATSSNVFLTSLAASSLSLPSPFSALQLTLPPCNLLCQAAGSSPWKVLPCSPDTVHLPYQDLRDFNFHAHLPSPSLLFPSPPALLNYLCFLNALCSFCFWTSLCLGCAFTVV